ncbi:MAG: hypothetical protein DMF61_26715 [Blastocatellia bacterium AA13]|nr:MAG: hypothetical protein DMF61_26715 [Blastocatellia bacterium AA13]
MRVRPWTWTLVGCGVAAAQGVNVRAFVKEWMNYQGFFLLWLGTWLLLMMRSKAFVRRVSLLTTDGTIKLGLIQRRFLRILVVGGTTILGFFSLARMRFNGQGGVLLFMWFTCLSVVFAAGLVTLHSLEILVVIHNLQHQNIKVSRYAPAFVADEASRPAQKNGWYIRVCDGLTEASTILLDIGYGGDEGSHYRWGQWDRTVPLEFDVPPQFRTIPEIWINGYAIPERRQGERI